MYLVELIEDVDVCRLDHLVSLLYSILIISHGLQGVGACDGIMMHKDRYKLCLLGEISFNLLPLWVLLQPLDLVRPIELV